MKSVLDGELLLLELPDHHGTGVRPAHDLLNFIVQMSVVALQTLSFQKAHVQSPV